MLGCRRWLWGIGCVSLALSIVGGAAAQVSKPATARAGCTHSRYVVLSAQPGLGLELLAEVRKDLAAELAPRGMCVRGERTGGAELVADIVLGRASPAQVSIHVDDLVTGKRVARDLSLAKIPAQGAALAIAIGIDELLRASWAELMLRERAEERPSVPPHEGAISGAAVRAPAAKREGSASGGSPRSGRSSPSRWGLGAVAGYTHSRLDWDAFALELRASARPLRWSLIELGALAFRARDVDVQLGTARAWGLAGALTLAGCLHAWPRVSLCGGARGNVQWIEFRGVHARAAEGMKNDLVSVWLSALAQARVGLSQRLSLLAEMTLGGALRGARATDGQKTVLGLNGLIVGAGLGLELAL